MNTIKFLKDGIRYNGKYIRVFYSQSKLTGYPEGTITIYAREYGHQLPTELQPSNDSEPQTDYFDKDKARIPPNSPYHKQILDIINKKKTDRETSTISTTQTPNVKVTPNSPQFKAWMAGVQEIINRNYTTSPTPAPKMIFMDGKRYIRIVEVMSGNQRMAFAFIDKTNGDVLKTAGWNAPARHARGNLFDQWLGLKYVGPYGMAYLR
jgi:hypothetical protein